LLGGDIIVFADSARGLQQPIDVCNRFCSVSQCYLYPATQLF